VLYIVNIDDWGGVEVAEPGLGRASRLIQPASPVAGRAFVTTSSHADRGGQLVEGCIRRV
jgi:hypothetical protein